MKQISKCTYHEHMGLHLDSVAVNSAILHGFIKDFIIKHRGSLPDMVYIGSSEYTDFIYVEREGQPSKYDRIDVWY